MNRLEHGLKRAFEEVIGGFVTSAIVYAIASSGLLSPAYLLLFGLINVIGTVTLVYAMPYWGTTYLIGWLFGVGMLLQSGLIGIEAILYIGIPLLYLILRAKAWFER